MKTYRNLLHLAAIIAAAVITASTAHAQVGWMNPIGDRGISISFLKGDFSERAGLKFGTSVWSITGRAPMARNFSFVAQLPMSHVSAERVGYGYYSAQGSESQFGNLYAGLEIAGETSSPIAEFGVWLPTAQAGKYDAKELGTLTTWDRFEAFVPKLITATGKFGYRYRGSLNPALTLKILVGPTFMVPDQGDPELLADYSGEFWVRYRRFGVGAGFTGRAILTESSLDIGEATTHQFGMAGDVTLGSIRLGGSLRVPLDQPLSNEVNLVYGLNLAFDFK